MLTPVTASEIKESLHKTARAWERYFDLPYKSLIEIQGTDVMLSRTPLPNFYWSDPIC